MMTISTTENREFTAQARRALTGRWGHAALTTLIYLALSRGAGLLPRVGVLAELVVAGPMAIGYAHYALQAARGHAVTLAQLFVGFARFWVGLKAFLMMMGLIFLWSLLLIVPGIIAALSYSMTFYLLADDDTLSASAALAQSRLLMLGNRWKLFCLGCRFIGWSLLSVVTFGIGFLWLMPYLSVAQGCFYDEIRGQPAAAPASEPPGFGGFDSFD